MQHLLDERGLAIMFGAWVKEPRRHKPTNNCGDDRWN
jgi:hypothetical protein